MSTENGTSLTKWLKDHSYALIVAGLLIAGDFALINFRVNEIDVRLRDLEIKVEENREEIRSIQIQNARDITEIKTILLRLDEGIKGLINQQKQRDRDIQEFYQKYDLTPKAGGNNE